MTSGLTRQETIAVTGVNSSRLSYMDATMLVSPEKIGNPKRPNIVYSWEKIIQIKLVDKLRGRITLQEIRKVLPFIEERSQSPLFFDYKLAFISGELHFIENWQDFGTIVLDASRKNKGRVVVHEIVSIKEVVAELLAKKDGILDFDKRIKGTLLESQAPSTIEVI